MRFAWWHFTPIRFIYPKKDSSWWQDCTTRGFKRVLGISNPIWEKQWCLGRILYKRSPASSQRLARCCHESKCKRMLRPAGLCETPQRLNHGVFKLKNFAINLLMGGINLLMHCHLAKLQRRTFAPRLIYWKSCFFHLVGDTFATTLVNTIVVGCTPKCVCLCTEKRDLLFFLDI